MGNSSKGKLYGGRKVFLVPWQIALLTTLTMLLILPEQSVAYYTSLTMSAKTDATSEDYASFNEYSDSAAVDDGPHAQVAASFSLATGDVKFSIDAQTPVSPSNISHVELQCYLRDLIYPSYENPGMTDPFDVTVAWTIDGNVSGTDTTPYSFFSKAAIGLDSTPSLPWPSGDELTNLMDGYEYISQTVSFDPTSNSFVGFSFYLEGIFNPSEGTWIEADFLNTATLDIILPQGVTFTSDSGVLLTEKTAVPLPASIWLLVTGLGGLGFVRRRRKKSASNP